MWLVSFALLAILGCSRGSGDPPQDGGPGKSSASPPAAAAPAAPSTAGSATLPTPQAVENDAVHQITEQNLESELDRLEREIQAE